MQISKQSPIRPTASLAALMLAAALAACGGGSGGGGHAAVGGAAPGWTAITAAGTKLSMHALRGQPVYLNFFATWCPPCNAEAPAINALQKAYRSQGLRVVGIDELESARAARGFVKKYGLVYPVVVDGGTLQSEYDVNGLPVHVFIKRDGDIYAIRTGEMSRAQILTDLRAILAG